MLNTKELPNYKLESPKSNNKDLIDRILDLKKKKKVVILSHFYQPSEIQDIADFVGDSLALAEKASKTNSKIILFAGVYFMAETAKILNPTKKVLIPDPLAGCSLADSCNYYDFKAFTSAHPNHKVVTYINCSASIKTLSDIVCTSSNAVSVINSFPKNQPIIFAPDKNLGNYLQKQTGRKLLLWDGACVVHEAFSLEKLILLKNEYPNSEIIAHPESEDQILTISNFIGSTSALIKYSKTSKSKTIIVATEEGILHQLRKEIPNKIFIPAPSNEDNTCACSECGSMKLNSLHKIFAALNSETPEVLLDDQTILRAGKPLQRMLLLSKK